MEASIDEAKENNTTLSCQDMNNCGAFGILPVD